MTHPLAERAGMLAERISRRRVGVVVACQTAGGVVIEGRGRTGKGGVPDGATLFEIGSITKVFTALLLADGVVRGDWELRTPVRDLLPEDVSVPSRGGVQITLQHLATHTSGLPRSPKGIGLRDNLAYLRHGRDPYAGFSEADLFAALAGARLARVPGRGGVRYSNFGYGVLGAALSSASGLDYGALVRDRICVPLGLTDTVTANEMDAGQRERLAVGHRGRRRAADYWPLPGLLGAGALRSTAADLMRMLAVQVDPAGTPLEAAIRLTHATPLGGPARMGLGWHRAGTATLWHNGGTGGFRSIAAIRPDRGAASLILVNQAKGADLAALRLLDEVS